MIMMAPTAFIIAGPDRAGLTNVILWAVILLAVVFASVAAIYILRRMLLDKNERRNAGFTTDQMERLRDEGLLTEEEYRLARRAALGLDDPGAPDK